MVGHARRSLRETPKAHLPTVTPLGAETDLAPLGTNRDRQNMQAGRVNDWQRDQSYTLNQRLTGPGPYASAGNRIQQGRSEAARTLSQFDRSFYSGAGSRTG